MGILDLLFPKTCVGCNQIGHYICFDCEKKIEYFETQICSSCYRNTLDGRTHKFCSKNNPLEGVFSLVNYQTPTRELIHQLKYRFTTDLLTEISEKIDFLKIKKDFSNFTVIPVPLHYQRQNYRGFNQAELLGRVVAAKLNLKLEPNILERVEKTISQVGLSKAEREKNLRQTLQVKYPIKKQKYLVFDDVWTSGATLKAAANVLKKAGAIEVWGLTLAHKR